jgi:hypothetical protein
MPKSSRLNDLQLNLVSHAAKHDGASLFPLPAAALSDPGHTETELKSLLRRELVAQASAADAASTWRAEEDQNISLFMLPKWACKNSSDLARKSAPVAMPSLFIF